MKVFKFGGASVKDAGGVQNVGAIISSFPDKGMIVVVSAIGKTTNALEHIAGLAFEGKDFQEPLENLIAQHNGIATELGLQAGFGFFGDMIVTMAGQNSHRSYPQFYDQVVSVGELMSSSLLSQYLLSAGIANTWVDARELIRTDNTWREGQVNWDATLEAVQNTLPQALQQGHVVTQGFIGGAPDGFTTTLGREGSDYTAAILANCMNAEGQWIWKDVDGVYNADPKVFPNSQLIPEISYYEAIEITNNGAQVIHPKTIKPLFQKKIPLFVRSFINLGTTGTVIKANDPNIQYPTIIGVKQNQILLSIKPKDFSFIIEDHLILIEKLFAHEGFKINHIQLSALTISIIFEDQNNLLDHALSSLSNNYTVAFNKDLELYSIRHYTESSINNIVRNRIVLLEQKTRTSAYFLLKKASH